MSDVDVMQDAGLPEGAPPVAMHFPSPGPHAGHARERNRRLASSVGTALLIKPLALLAPLITTPLFLHYLGKESFGLYATVISISALLGLTNAGLTLGLVNRLMDCNVSGDRELARRYVSSLMTTLAALVVVGLLIWSVVSFIVPWHQIFQIHNSATARQTPWIVWITGVSTLLGLFFTMPVAIYSAYQELNVANIWDGFAKLATFAASVAIVYTKFGLIGVALAASGVPVFIAMLNTYFLFRRKPWIRPRLSCFDRRLVRSTLADGILLFLIQTSIVAIFQCDKLVISARLGAEQVTQYSILATLFVSTYGLFIAIQAPLWAAHGEAVRRGDWAWVQRAMRLSLFFGCGMCAACGLVLLLFGDRIFAIWPGGDFKHVSASLIIAMTAMFVLRAWVDCRSIILASANVLVPQVYLFVGHATLNLIAAVLLAKRFGVLGVAWATPITALLTTTWGYPLLMRRLVHSRTKLPATPAAIAPVPAVATNLPS